MDLLEQIPAEVKSEARRLAFDGTSATAILLDADTGSVLENAKLYNEAQPQASVTAAKVLPQSAQLYLVRSRQHGSWTPMPPSLPTHQVSRSLSHFDARCGYIPDGIQ